MKKINQNYFAEFVVANPTMRLKEVAAALGISEDTAQRYNADSETQAIIKELAHKRFDSLAAKAVAACEEKVLNGEWAAIKFVLENTGYKLPEQVDLNTPNTITIQIGE